MPARAHDRRPHGHVHEAVRPAPGLTPSALDDLHERVGGPAAAAWLQGAGLSSGTHVLQAKLTVGSASDPAEHEADRAAEAIVAGRPAVVGSDTGVRRSAQGPGQAFDAGPAVTQSLDRARGGGAPLADTFRSRAESSLGVDLSGVRVHADPAAARLAGSLSALAFTRGSDVFLGSRAPAPGTAAGEKLLAHEVAHVAQQGGGTDGPVRRKLDLQTFRWSEVTAFQVMETGGSGKVAKISDSSSSLFVKVDQETGDEVVVASHLHNAVSSALPAAGDAGEEVHTATPSVRTLTARDLVEIKKVAARFKPPKGASKLTQDRYAGFLTALDGGRQVVVMTAAAGQEAHRLVQDSFDDDHSIRPGSLLHGLLYAPQVMQTLGRIAAADCVMSMNDRVLSKLNLQNMVYDAQTRTLHLTDNTQKGVAGYLNHRASLKAEPFNAFTWWSQNTMSGGPLLKDPAALASVLIDTVADNLKYTVERTADAQDAPPAATTHEQQDTIKKAVRVQRAAMEAAGAQGATEALPEVLRVLSQPEKLVSGVSKEERRNVLQSLYARHLWLGSSTGDLQDVWDRAGELADKREGVLTSFDRQVRREESAGERKQRMTALEMLHELNDPASLPSLPGKSGKWAHRLSFLSSEARHRIEREDDEVGAHLREAIELVRWRNGRTSSVLKAFDTSVGVGQLVARGTAAQKKNVVVLQRADAWLAQVKAKDARKGALPARKQLAVERRLLQAGNDQLTKAVAAAKKTPARAKP